MDDSSPQPSRAMPNGREETLLTITPLPAFADVVGWDLSQRLVGARPELSAEFQETYGPRRLMCLATLEELTDIAEFFPRPRHRWGDNSPVAGSTQSVGPRASTMA